MLFGSRSKERLPVIGAPSTTYRGWLEPEMEFLDLIITLVLVPKKPPPVLIWTPGILPVKIFEISVSGFLSISSDVIVVTVYPRAFSFRAIPWAVITTSSKAVDWESVKFAIDDDTVCEELLYPT